MSETGQPARSPRDGEALHRHAEQDLVASLITTLDGRILSCNDAFARLFGFRSREDAASARITSLYVSPRDRQALLERVRAEVKVSSYEIEMKRLDGSRVVVVENVLGIFDERGELVRIQGYMLDITDRVRAEEALRRRVELEGIVAGISRVFATATADGFSDAVNEALRRISVFGQVDRSYLFLLSEDGSTMDNSHEWTSEGTSPAIERLQRLRTEDFPWWMERMRRGEPAHFTRAADLPPEAQVERRILEPLGARSVLGVPLMVAGSLAGFLGFDAVRAEKVWTDEDIRLLGVVAESIAAALERHRADQAQRRQIRETAFLSRVISAAASALDPRTSLHQVCRELAGAFDVSAVAAALLSEDRARLDVIAEQAINPRLSVDGLSFALRAAWLERLFGPEGTRPVVIRDLGAHPQGDAIRQTLGGREVSAIVVVPLVAHGEPIGVVALLCEQPSEFSERDLSLAEHAAAAAGQALANARLYEATRWRAEELGALADVSAAMRTAGSRAELFPALLDRVLIVLRAEGASLALRDPTTGDTVHHLGVGAWAAWTGIHLPQGTGISGHVIASGEPYASADVSADPHLVRLDRFAGIHSVVCVPLITETQTVGAMWVGRRTPFSRDEVHLACAIGNMAATAIHRTTLREQTERQLQRLTATQAIDRAITSSLDLRIVLRMLAEEVVAAMRVDGAAVFLFRPATMALECAASRGVPFLEGRTSPIALSSGLAGRAVLERSMVFARDLGQAPPRLALAMEQAGFVAALAVPLVARGQVKGVLEVFSRAPLEPSPDWLEFLDGLAAQAAVAADNAEMFGELQRSHFELTLAYDATLEGWGRALDLRDRETEGHTRRVTALTLRLAAEMGVPEHGLVHVRRGALLHDIGKIGVPDAILLKPGPLTEDEWVVMRRHPVLARDMLAAIPFLRSAIDIPYCHHERWDGGGYPQGLAGESIPLSARIFAVTDVWDALRSDRPYRRAWSEEEALAYMREQSGAHFDPEVIRRFLALSPDVRRN